MAIPKLTKLELLVMEALWSRGALSIREIQEAFPEKGRPHYSTVQTAVYRLETKKAVRRPKRSAMRTFSRPWCLARPREAG